METRTITIIIEIALLAFCGWQLFIEMYEVFTGKNWWAVIKSRRDRR